MKYSADIREEELKNKVAQDFFGTFDWTQIVGNLDFAIALRSDDDNAELFEREFLLWAEAKAGTKKDIYESFVQLILTIGKARTYESHPPPAFLGAFDAEKIAFIPYHQIQDVFHQNDFNWNVTPSNHGTKEFKQLFGLVSKILEEESLRFRYDEDEKELKKFIRENFVAGKSAVSKFQITKNNFIHIYRKWVKLVKPSILIDWEVAKKENLIDADFYLADLLSRDNLTLKDKLYVLLKSDKYVYNIKRKATGALNYDIAEFQDGQHAHNAFWKKYERPPKEDYWDYIIARRDLLVPQDVRERKGSFFTPSKWVELSQEYLARELGENWQDEYYIWDCCAGTGNLLAGLTNKYNIYASTLDKADVDVMQDLIATNALNLLDTHVFQFDFLNDSFDKLPASLREIINDEEKRKKLVIYINPPYAEATTAKTVTGTGKNKAGVAIGNTIDTKYKEEIRNAANEVFALFFIRIYRELQNCVLAEFSKLKILQARNFSAFRNVFQSKLSRIFVVPADTFDNVNGQFPIGFHIWQTSEKEVFNHIIADVYDKAGNLAGTKQLQSPKDTPSINQWIKAYDSKTSPKIIGYMENPTPDFQNNKFLCITNKKGTRHNNYYAFSLSNIFSGVVYLAVRQCIHATWLNDRDQFLKPQGTWQADTEFQYNCLSYTLLHGQNRITATEGTNHWIPFTEQEVGARERFESHFMVDYINGRKSNFRGGDDLFDSLGATSTLNTPIKFSPEAQAVMDAGRELWKYYHSKPGVNVNASFYDIRLFFQGTNERGKMNPDSKDERYTELIKNLRSRLRELAAKIAPKVYEHGFLMR